MRPLLPSWAMGFFDLPEREAEDDELDDDDDDDFYEGLRPAAWIGGVVPVELVVARSDEAAVAVTRISAYSDGFELVVNSYLRRSAKRNRRLHLHPRIWHEMGEPGDPVPGELLRFGLAWPDGGRATNLGEWGRSWPDATEPAHGLESRSGSGSDIEYSEEYWAWPLPEDGPLLFVVEWPGFGIAETTASIDGGLLVEAASRARPVWEQDADKTSHVRRGAFMRSATERHRQADGGLADL